MKTKSSKSQKKKRSPLFWLSIIALPLAIVVGTVWINDYNHDRQVDSEEDVTFAKIETFVNGIKKDLDREIPQGKWKIAKSCDAPNTKGDFEEYSCSYEVRSDSTDVPIDNFASTLKRFFITRPIEVTATDISGYEKPDADSGCNIFYGRGEENYSVVACTSGSHSIRYDLVQR